MVSRPAVAPNTSRADLFRAVQQYGTPLYVYDVDVLYERVKKLRTSLPKSVQILFSLKANPSLGICSILASLGLGADVASEGEFLIANAANFCPSRILIGGPAKSKSLLGRLEAPSKFLISIDSVSELETLASGGISCRALLRLRPRTHEETCSGMGAFSRFGVPANELNLCLPFLESSVKVVGFHAYMGSQFLPASEVVRSLRDAVDLCDFAACQLKLRPEELNLGGGFGIPYSEDETELDLEPIGRELERLCQEGDGARLSVELGRYIVGPCGWYLTRVVEKQSHEGRPAVVVDGGVHQHFDICGLNLPSRCQKPAVLGLEETDERMTVDVLGCLCMPSDILAVECELPPLATGAVLAFPNSGAYGLTASPTGFLCHATPPEVALQAGKLSLLREAGSAESFLSGQRRISVAGRDDATG